MCEFYSNKYNQMPRKPDPKPPQSKKRDFTGEYLSAIVNSGTVHEITSGGIQKHFNDFAKTHHRQRLRGPQLYEIVRILMGVETRRCTTFSHYCGLLCHFSTSCGPKKYLLINDCATSPAMSIFSIAAIRIAMSCIVGSRSRNTLGAVLIGANHAAPLMLTTIPNARP